MVEYLECLSHFGTAIPELIEGGLLQLQPNYLVHKR